MTTVELIDLTKRYGRTTTAVQNLSLTIPSGEITALLGPSGCGKTTTLKMIAGLLTPTAGDIRFDGQSVTAVPAEKRTAVMAFQNHLLFPYMSVGDNVGFGLKMRRLPKDTIRQKVAHMLEMVQLGGYQDRGPAQLSGGQQQRVALARALVTEPDVLLLDEPLSNLDAHLRDEMRELILGLQRRLKITTVFVTHDQEEAVILADRIALMFAGELQQFAPPRDFYDRPRTADVARFFGGCNFIPGRMTADGRFEVPAWQTALRVPTEAPAHGREATIRPEHVRLVEKRGENTISAVVESAVYHGTHTRLWVTAGPVRLRVQADAHTAVQPGQQVWVRLPTEKLWLFADRLPATDPHPLTPENAAPADAP